LVRTKFRIVLNFTAIISLFSHEISLSLFNCPQSKSNIKIINFAHKRSHRSSDRDFQSRAILNKRPHNGKRIFFEMTLRHFAKRKRLFLYVRATYLSQKLFRVSCSLRITFLASSISQFSEDRILSRHSRRILNDVTLFLISYVACNIERRLLSSAVNFARIFFLFFFLRTSRLLNLSPQDSVVSRFPRWRGVHRGAYACAHFPRRAQGSH